MDDPYAPLAYLGQLAGIMVALLLAPAILACLVPLFIVQMLWETIRGDR